MPAVLFNYRQLWMWVSKKTLTVDRLKPFDERLFCLKEAPLPDKTEKKSNLCYTDKHRLIICSLPTRLILLTHTTPSDRQMLCIIAIMLHLSLHWCCCTDEWNVNCGWSLTHIRPLHVPQTKDAQTKDDFLVPITPILSSKYIQTSFLLDVDIWRT